MTHVTLNQIKTKKEQRIWLYSKFTVNLQQISKRIFGTLAQQELLAT